MKYPAKCKVLTLIVLLATLFLINGVNAQVQTARNISMVANSKGFYEYLPEGYSSGSQTYPLIIFLHGMGELGNGGADLSRVVNTGLPRLIQQGRFPTSFTTSTGEVQRFIVISPQFVNWPAASEVNAILDYVIRNYRVNVNRVYVTGLSMGGGATWEFPGDNATYARRVAAIVPIAGASWPEPERAYILADNGVAVWATHNDGDGTVPVFYTNDYISLMQARNPSNPAKKTIFSSTSHDAWTKTYDPAFTENGKNIYQWMLQYQRGSVTTPSNISPTARAGSDVSFTLPTNSTQLNGLSSSDPDGTIASYSWSRISGPTQFTFSNAAIGNPVFSNLVAGTYTLRLTVTDNKGATATDDVVVTVNAIANQAPISNAGVDQVITLPTNSVQLNGGVSSDPDGTIASYSWSKISGPTQFTFSSSSIVNPVLSNLVAGSYTLRLTVTDSRGATATDDVNVTVNSTPTSTYKPVPGRIEAEDYSAMSGIQTQTTTDVDGSRNVSGIETGDWMDYNINVTAGGYYDIGFRVAAPAAGSKFQLRKSDGTVLTTITVPATGGYQSWTLVMATASVWFASGNQVIRLQALSSGFNINWFSFAAPGATLPPPTTPPVGTSRLIRVNIFGGSNSYSNSEWNNWNLGAQYASNINSGALKYSDGTASSVTANLSYSESVVDNGTGYSGSMAPAEVLRYTSYAVEKRTLTINGLSADKKYDIEFYASRNTNAGNSTVFIIGGVSQTVPTYNNVSQKVSFAGLTPSSQGQIVVTVSQGSDYNYLNGFVITEKSGTLTAARVGTSTIDLAEPEIAKSASVQAYPNPVTDRVTLQINNEYRGALTIQVIDLNGAVKKEFRTTKNQVNISQTYSLGSDLPAGTYFIRIRMGQQTSSLKVVKL